MPDESGNYNRNRKVRKERRSAFPTEVRNSYYGELEK